MTAIKSRKPTGAVPWPLVLIEGPEKSGKAQPLHSRIATPTGWTTMGELTEGDSVLGANGKATRVSAVYDRGERDIYRVTFSDGVSVEACDEHLWATWTSSSLHSRFNKGPKKGQRNPRPAVVRTTAQIREMVLDGTVIHIPVTAPVEYAVAAPLPMSPYALGLLLGDGCFRTSSGPTITPGDTELFGALDAELPVGDHVSIHANWVSAGVIGGSTTRILREMGLDGAGSADKFIPEPYMTASPTDRLAMIQGLLDTDGGMENKSITYSSASERMASQVRELVHSIGGTCRMKCKTDTFYPGPNGEKLRGKPAHILVIRMPLGVSPFRLARKAERREAVAPSFNTPPRRTVKSVDYVGQMPARCITVEAADHLYLTEGFVVTHNSYAAVTFTASPRIGQAYWLDLGEGAADEYASIDGANYLVLEHDGTWADIVGQVAAVRDEAARAQRAGEPPVVLVIDSMTAEWELLKAWTQDRANRSKAGIRTLAADPDAEVKPAFNLWNDANARHGKLMQLLMTFPGVVVMTARGKDVAALDDNGKPIPNAKDYRVEGHKTLAFDSTAWVRLSRENHPVVVGVRSLVAGVAMRPGEKPKPWPEFSIDALVFDEMRCDPTGAKVRALQPTTTADTPVPKWYADAPDMIRGADAEQVTKMRAALQVPGREVFEETGRLLQLVDARAAEIENPAPEDAAVEPAQSAAEPGWFASIPTKIARAEDQAALDPITAALSHPSIKDLARTGELLQLVAEREAVLAAVPSHEEAAALVAAELGGTEQTEDAA